MFQIKTIVKVLIFLDITAICGLIDSTLSNICDSEMLCGCHSLCEILVQRSDFVPEISKGTVDSWFNLHFNTNLREEPTD